MKKNYLKIALCAALLCGATLSGNAIKAKPGLLPMQQPDGSTLMVQLMGDENMHFYLTEDGYLLDLADNGTFYYATTDAQGMPVRSQIKATAPNLRDAAARRYLDAVQMPAVLKTLEKRSLGIEKKSAKMTARAFEKATAQNGVMRGPGLFTDGRYPVTGDQKGLVILVEYKDIKMTLTNPKDYFTRMLNEPGFNLWNGTGSAKDFYEENSNGQFRPTFDVYGPITLSQNRSYYGGNGWGGNDSNPEVMAIEACQQLDATVDFTQYDRDGDGYIDNVYIFYAGRGEASGGPAESVWPHSWNVTAGTSTPYVFDGVRLDRYACSNEYEGSRPDGVGTFIHEFSHVMGVPDLYATSYTSSFTPGRWSCMDVGPYNNNGITPPLYGAFERYALSWMEPLPVESPVNATLEPIGTNKAGIVKTASNNEFFLLENRQQTSWDKYIPGHGMLIWHVDFKESVWNTNKVNNTPEHQYVDIEEADNIQSESTRAGDAFPGTANVRSFTDDTKPSMRTWANQALGTPITDIAESAQGIITFKVKGGSTTPLQVPVALEADDFSDTSFVAKWTLIPDADFALTVYTKDENGTKNYLFQDKNVGRVAEYYVGGLQAGNEYFYTVRMGTGWEYSDASNEINVFTGKAPLNKLRVEATDADNVTETSFTAHWNTLEDAENYELTVFTKEPTGFFHQTCDFTGGADGLPEGWSTNTGNYYNMASFAGKAVPALRMGADKCYLTTSPVTDDIKRVSFWHRGSSTSASDVINVEVKKADGTWTTVASVPVITTSGGVVTDIDVNMPGSTCVRLMFMRNGGKGSLAIDDVDVSHGVDLEDTPLPAYNAVPAGNVNNAEVEGLTPGTTYYYTLTATAGALRSRQGNVATVTTLPAMSGINNTAVAASAVKLIANGRTVTVEAPATMPVRIYEPTGRTAAAGITGRAITLGTAGVYIVNVGGQNFKVLVK